MFLGVLSLFALFGVGSDFSRGIYLVGFALIVGIAACWLGITALQRAKRSHSWRPRGAIFGIVFGVIGALISALGLLAFLLFWPQFSQFSRCLGGANTVSSQQGCLNQFERSMNANIPWSKAGS